MHFTLNVGSNMMKHSVQILTVLLLSLIFNSCDKKHEYPKELEYCFEYLDENWDPKEIEIFKNITEKDSTPRNYHFGIGLHLRNYLIKNHKYSDTLQDFFDRNGIFHYDDMSGIILHSYHKYLNNEDLELQEQFERYISYWEPIIACDQQQDSLARSYFEYFDLKDTIQVRMPMREDNNAFNYSCYLDWVYNDSTDLEITGVIINKYFSDTSDMMNLDLFVLEKSKLNAEIFMRQVQVGDTFNVHLKTSWKLLKIE